MKEQHNAGWSSLEARRAHNPKVTGSNPVPAIPQRLSLKSGGFSIMDDIHKKRSVI